MGPESLQKYTLPEKPVPLGIVRGPGNSLGIEPAQTQLCQLGALYHTDASKMMVFCQKSPLLVPPVSWNMHSEILPSLSVFESETLFCHFCPSKVTLQRKAGLNLPLLNTLLVCPHRESEFLLKFLRNTLSTLGNNRMKIFSKLSKPQFLHPHMQAENPRSLHKVSVGQKPAIGARRGGREARLYRQPSLPSPLTTQESWHSG